MSNHSSSLSTARTMDDLSKRLDDTAFLCTRVSELATEHEDKIAGIKTRLHGIRLSDNAKSVVLGAASASAAMASVGAVCATMGVPTLPALVAGLIGGRFTFDMTRDVTGFNQSEAYLWFEDPETLITRAEKIMASVRADRSTVDEKTINKWDAVDKSLLYTLAELSKVATEQKDTAETTSPDK